MEDVSYTRCCQKDEINWNWNWNWKENEIQLQTSGHSLEETRVKIRFLYLALLKEEKYGNIQNCSISRGWRSITMETGWEARGGTKSDASSFFTPPPFLKLQFLMGNTTMLLMLVTGH